MDLNLLPLARQYGQDMPDLPGLHIAARPRRTARGRQADRLILYFVMEGNAQLSPSQQEQLLARLAQTYYKTKGSVTAALRATAESLNQQLLDHNLKEASSGQQGVGLLMLMSLREERIYLAQCGPTHAFLLSSGGMQHLYDPQPTRRGLGLGRTTPVYFSQISLTENDVLILTPQPPAEWSETALGSLYGQGLETIRPRLMKLAGIDLSALLIQAKAGPGKVFLLRPKPATATPDSAPIALGAPVATAAVLASAELPVEVAESTAEPVSEEATVEEQPEAEAIPPAPIPTAAATPIPPAWETMPAAAEQAAPPPATSEEKAAGSRRRRASGKGFFAAITAALATTVDHFSQSLRNLFRRMLPEESLAALPGPLMAFIAVAIPLVVVAVSMVVYFQRGRASQYDQFYSQAVQSAEQAQALTDPQNSLAAWQNVIVYLDQADTYETTPESQALRLQAYQAVDQAQLIRRLDYQPALTEFLPDGAQVIEVAATESDLYMLDASNGSVRRAFSTARGYELDPTFQCGPGFVGSQGIGPLVDMVALPAGQGASVLGMDAQANLLYCKPGEPPLFDVLTPPFTQWGKPSALALSANNLYVLDPEKNAVWIYWNADKATQPEAFFTENFPPMADVIDMAVEKNDLFLLHVDGHTTLCTYSELGVAITQCTDPLPYIDSRPGHEGQVLAPYPAFSKIVNTQPPDPSTYLLDATHQALYHFSQRLAFQRQLRPQTPISGGDASAFAFRPDNRLVFLAVGNQVYYAGMP